MDYEAIHIVENNIYNAWKNFKDRQLTDCRIVLCPLNVFKY